MLTGKTVLLGVSGGIACYKAAQLASDLVKQHANVHVVMTRNAAEFITPLTFEALTGNRPVLDTFDRNFPHEVKHISLAEQADLVTGVFILFDSQYNVGDIIEVDGFRAW